MFNLKRINRLEKRIDELEKQIEELQKRTISQRTTVEEPPVSVNQVLDEWLNGEAEDNGN